MMGTVVVPPMMGAVMVVTPMMGAAMVAPMGVVVVMPPRFDVHPCWPIVVPAIVDLVGTDRRRTL